MKLFRILLIFGIFALIIIVVTMFFSSSQSVPVSDTPDEPMNFPQSQDITVIPDDEPDDKPVVTVFEDTPDDYQITDVSPGGLLTSVSKSNPSPEFQSLLSTVFIDVFWVKECVSPSGERTKALIVTAEPNADLGDEQFSATEQAIWDWESQIVPDIGSTLFPSLNQAQLDSVNTTFTSYNLESRFTSFTIGASEYQVHYGWVLNFAVFATSHNCLVATINDLYAPYSH